MIVSQMFLKEFTTHLQADRDTDEIYAQLTLQPVNSVRTIVSLTILSAISINL